VGAFSISIEGARGFLDERVQKAISLGIAKINVDTEVRIAFTTAMRGPLTDSSKEFDPREILGSAKDAKKGVVKGKMRLFRSLGEA
jgi:fructose-bisphosphate aldolase class II